MWRLMCGTGHTFGLNGSSSQLLQFGRNFLTRVQYIEMNATSTWMNMEHFDLLVTKRNVCFEQTSEFQETI